MKEVAVAVGVIVDQDLRILIAQRPLDKHQGGFWEFPGGKIEAGESTPAALVRELQEELGLLANADAMTALTEIRFRYPDKAVLLDVWIVPVSAGAARTAHGAEGQPVCWVTREQLADYEFPAANQPILDALQQAAIFTQ